MDWLATGIEQLVDACRCDAAARHFDVIIIGSGYGGAVMAARLARLRRADGKPIRLAVLERGREYVPGEFPQDIGTLPGHVRIDRWNASTPVGAADALFNFQVNPDVSLLTGCALGGGSQINANVAIEALPSVLSAVSWPRVFREDPALLKPYYARARKMLGVTTYPGSSDKFQSLRNVARPIARRFESTTSCRQNEKGARFSRAPIAVTFAQSADGSTSAAPSAIEQSPCIECGNCVSGCNHWAKNTLTMNYLPRARQWGARLYTGATVTRLWRDSVADGCVGRENRTRWLVQIDATSAETAPDRRLLIDGKPVVLSAQRVIIAAGAVGSTELLLRSRRTPQQSDGLMLSPKLGQGFSTNGDMISAAYWQRDPVNAVGFSPAQLNDAAQCNGTAPSDDTTRTPRPVGPTITGLIDLRDAKCREQQVLIQDGAIPGALADIWAELLATTALPHQLMRWQSQASRWDHSNRGRKRGADRRHCVGLLVSDEAAQHSQLLLAMGHDDAGGVMKLRAPSAGADGFRRVRIDWRDELGRRPADQPVFEHQSNWLRGVESSGAIRIDNPLWKALPNELATTLGDGTVRRGTLMTVHPLGGCRMADEAALGVVDASGQVYDGDRGASVHPGLYVCDGSILPSSLGANPLLTISALAERQAQLLIEKMMRQDGFRLGDCDDLTTIARPVRDETSPSATLEASQDDRVGLRFRERMRNQTDIGQTLVGLQELLKLDPTTLPVDPAERKRLRLALDVELNIDDLRAYVRAPLSADQSGLRVNGSLSIQQDTSPLIPGQQVQVWNAHQLTLHDGEFALFDEPPQNALLAMLRGARQFTKVKTRHSARSSGFELRKLWMYMKLCRQVGIRRRIDYRFRMTGKDGRPYELRGRKHIEFADRINPWLSLADLDASISPLNDQGNPGAPIWRDTMRLDPLHVLRHALPQATTQPHAPASILAMASYGLLFARTLLATHLFHFREPNYEPASTPRRLLPGPLTGLTPPEHHWLTIDDPADQDDDPPHPSLQICATRYRAASDSTASHRPGDKVPIVIFHGILHSSLAFATDTIDENLTQHLCQNGYEVWLIDSRTSIAFGRNPRPISFDRMARHDVPTAIDHVLTVSGAAQVNVFAHCMGAALFSMAMLGHDANGKRYVDPAKIRALCYCQVSFLVVNSYSNLLRAEAIALVRDGLNLKTINPRVDDSASAAERLLDRIAMTYPVRPAERDAHNRHASGQIRHDTAVCNRLNLLISTHWFHHNLDPRTHNRLSELLGPSHVETFFQIHHFGMRGRVMNAFGENVYATDDNLRAVFSQVPTFFIQGAESDVFDTRTTAAACDKLRELTGANRHHYRHYPGYGHLECVFGKDAATVVYPDVVAFFNAPPQQTASLPPIDTGLTAPDIGPLIGAATPLPADDPQAPHGLLLRLWYAPPTRASEVTDGALIFIRERSDTPAPLTATDFRPVTPARDTTAALTPYIVLEVPIPEHLLNKDLQILLANNNLCQSRPKDPGLIDIPIRIRDLSLMSASGTEASWTLQDPPELFVARAVELRSTQLRRLATPYAASGTRLLLGSCRHPGNFYERELSDRIFIAMACETEGERPITAAIFVGDQIYADATANFTSAKQPREHMTSLYAAAFKSPAARDLLRRVPCLMAGDDHEIFDNWSGLPDGNDDDRTQFSPRNLRQQASLRQRLAWAREAYEVFQWECSEGARATRRSSPGKNRLWHAGRLSGFAYFVVDNRFERTVDHRSGAAQRLFSPQQQNALLDWIDAQPANLPCFIVTGAAPWPPVQSVHANNAYLQRSDSWVRYPREFLALLEGIARRNLRNVVILCGDAHCSLTAQVRFRLGDTGWCGGFTVVQSSGLYTPYPFANDRNIDYGVKPGQTARFMHRYQANGASVDFDWTVRGGTDLRNYTILDLDLDAGAQQRWLLRVSHRGESGKEAAPPACWPIPF